MTLVQKSHNPAEDPSKLPYRTHKPHVIRGDSYTMMVYAANKVSCEFEMDGSCTHEEITHSNDDMVVQYVS